VQQRLDERLASIGVTAWLICDYAVRGDPDFFSL
jgi:hypothetical protein